MALTRKVLSIISAGGLAVVGMAIASPTHAFAGTGNASTQCEDGVGNDDLPSPLFVTNPITLGVQIASPALAGEGLGGGSGGTYVGLCYATGSYNNIGPEITGGIIGVGVGPGTQAGAVCYPDTNPQGVVISCSAATAPTFSVSPGPAGSSGDLVTVNVPFTVCFGSCNSTGAGLAPTGLLVGQLTPVAEPGIGVGYQLSNVQVYVNGVLVVNTSAQAGAYVNPFGAVADSLNFAQGGPCLANECVPDGYIETTGNAVAGFQVQGLSFNIPVPKECLYTNPAGQCP